VISDTYISTTCGQRIEVCWSLLNRDAPNNYDFDYNKKDPSHSPAPIEKFGAF